VTRRLAVDLTERVAVTFVEGFFAALGLSWVGDFGLPVLHSAAIGGAAAVLAMLKGAVATGVGAQGTASLVDNAPPRIVPPVDPPKV
jgi:hypothetical protein